VKEPNNTLFSLVDKFLLPRNFEAKNPQLLQLTFISHAVKGDKKRILELKIGDTNITLMLDADIIIFFGLP